MRRISILFIAASLMVLGLTACSRQESASNAATSSTSDSLLASNPVEQPAGSLTPQTTYQEPAKQAEPAPAATETRKPKSRASEMTKKSAHSSEPAQSAAPKGPTVEAGTAFPVAVSTQISTETANVGDTWTGEVKEAVVVGDRVAIPAGSTVQGVITAVTPAKQGERAALGLAVRSIMINGQTVDVSANTESIVAGSSRARNVGAVAGGAAAGALIGKVVGGGGKGALIGGLLGGAAASGAVAASKGYQVVVKEGSVLTFSVSQTVTIKS